MFLPLELGLVGLAFLILDMLLLRVRLRGVGELPMSKDAPASFACGGSLDSEQAQS